MYTVPNQKIIVCDTWTGNIPKGMTYSILPHDIDYAAQLRLPGNAYKLFMYLYKNRKGFELALSPADVHKKTNMGKAAYDKAVEELIDNGYLSHIGGNRYRVVLQPELSKGKNDSPSPDFPSTGFPSTENHMTGSMVSGGPPPDFRMTGSMVSGGEINTLNINNNNITIGGYQCEDNNIASKETNKVARGRTDGLVTAEAEEAALALTVRQYKRYTEYGYREAIEQVEHAFNTMQKIIGPVPLWQYFQFANEAEYKAAAEAGKRQMLAAQTKADQASAQLQSEDDLPDMQFDEDKLHF